MQAAGVRKEKQNRHICEECRWRSRLCYQNTGQEDPHVQAGAGHRLSPPKLLRRGGTSKDAEEVLKKPYLP